MSENSRGQAPSETAPSASSNPAPKPAAPAPTPNPALRILGLPNFRLRLPSRNWTIFLTIVGSWSGAVFYDRRQKKLAQKKWCTLVEHIAQESLPTNSLARRVTVVLAAPPGDGLRSAREHFTEYVKPILVAGALDWDVIEGRREGEVRAGMAEKIRRLRRKHGDPADTLVDRDVKMALEEVRARTGIDDYQGQNGDLVIGRHTWKEYVRGLHEGWLGPIDPPKPVVEETASTAEAGTSSSLSSSTAENTATSTPSAESESEAQSTSQPDAASPPPTTQEEASPPADTDTKAEKPEEKKTEKPTKPPVTPPHNTPTSYPSSPLPSSCPSELPASIPIALPHLLGVINTPIRIYRFLTRRHLADDIGRQTAAAVLAAHRPYHHGPSTSTASTDSTSASEFSAETIDDSTTTSTTSTTTTWEQQRILLKEEQEWAKAARKRDEHASHLERVWLDDVVIDPRIGSRMRRFELEPGEEERAARIGKGARGVAGRRPGDDGGLEKDGVAEGEL